MFERVLAPRMVALEAMREVCQYHKPPTPRFTPSSKHYIPYPTYLHIKHHLIKHHEAHSPILHLPTPMPSLTLSLRDSTSFHST